MFQSLPECNFRWLFQVHGQRVSEENNHRCTRVVGCLRRCCSSLCHNLQHWILRSYFIPAQNVSGKYDTEREVFTSVVWKYLQFQVSTPLGLNLALQLNMFWRKTLLRVRRVSKSCQFFCDPLFNTSVGLMRKRRSMGPFTDDAGLRQTK